MRWKWVKVFARESSGIYVRFGHDKFEKTERNKK